MKELFEKEGRSIFTFKKGDIIIRLKPMVRKEMVKNDNLGIYVEIETLKDNSFRTPCEFLCIENNMIYLKVNYRFVGESISAIPLEEWSEDWGLFVIPEGLTLEQCQNL